MKWSPEDINKGNLEITTKIGCINMCEYCPQTLLIKRYKENQGDQKSPSKMMSFDNFKKYVSTIPSTINFHFTGYVEPFENPQAHEFLLWAHQRGHILKINTTLEGLTPTNFDKIKNIPYKNFFIHLPSATYEERIGVGSLKDKISTGQPKLRSDWLDLLEYVIKSRPQNFCTHAHGDCHPQAAELLRKLKAPFQGFKISNRSQNVSVSDKLKKERETNSSLMTKEKVPPHINIRGKCSRVYQPVLIPDGRLALCCTDYGLDHVIGDLSKQTWHEYRNSLAFKSLISDGADLCDYCDFGILYGVEYEE